MNRITLLLSFSLFLSACHKNPLSSGEAKEAITNYFTEEKYGLTNTYLIQAFLKEGPGYGNRLVALKIFIDRGLIRLKNRQKTSVKDSLYWQVYEITDKGRPYLIEEKKNENDFPMYIVRMSDSYVDGVSDFDFSPDKKEVLLKFTIRQKNATPFWAGEDISKRKSHFIGYLVANDSVWKMKQVQGDIDHAFDR